MTFGKTILWSALSVVGVSAILAPAQAVPVVPNFTQGSMTSHTETTQTITETINSMDYGTGYHYSVTGSGVSASGNLSPGTITANQLNATDGEAFSFSTTFTQGDALSTSAPTVGAVSNFSSQTSYAAGTAGDLAGTIGQDGAIAITAGGAGTSATGQFVSEITVID